MMLDDTELLRRYLADSSEMAFSELVHRHIDLVYSAALRMVDGDVHLAQDVTQWVFTDLARKAPRLLRHSSLTGWLYTSTRYIALKARRTEQRRRWREQKAYEMNELFHSTEPALDWNQLRPVLDDAMHALNDRDREAVLLRYFERRPLAEVGDRLGVSENAARMRVDRALDKLRLALAKRGVTSSATALAMALSKQAVGAAPAAFADAVSSAAVTAAASGGFATNLINIMLTTKMKMLAGALGAGVLATAILWSGPAGKTSEESTESNVQPTTTAPAATTVSAPAALTDSSPPMANSVIPANTLRLTMIDETTDRVVPGVQLSLRRWQGTKFSKDELTTGADGVCDVPLLSGTTQLELTTQKDGYADTRLQWRPDRGEVIPQAYVVRLDSPVRIGGRVVDFEGRGVAGAKVGFNHQDDPSLQTRPESHEFGWIEVTADAAGYWSINRIHVDILRRIYGGATHPEYVNSSMLFVSRDPTAEEKLREGTYVYQLGQAAVVRGTVVDDTGRPVANAKVSVGHVGESGRREGMTSADGAFNLSGCKPGRNLLTAEAADFAATTERVELSPDSGPFQLVLKPGKTLRLRVVDPNGRPVPNANVWLDTFGSSAVPPGQPEVVPVQVEFGPRTDVEGRVVWENAPDKELEFDFHAPGYMRVNDWKVRPDGEEHMVTLPPALIVSGTVRDAGTGQPIPKFRMVTGWPQKNHGDGSIQPRWNSLERFCPAFAGGEFRHSYEEAVIGGIPNPGYVLKFEAEGYSPAVTRTIAADEGEVRFEINLRPAIVAEVTVLLPNGGPAAGADVGLIAPGAQLQLVPGGFSREMGQSFGSLLRADDVGRFRFAPDEKVTRVIVAHPDGFADVAPDALTSGATFRLERWGRIEGTYKSSKSPVPTKYFKLEFQNIDRSSLSFDFSGFRVECDEQGRFQFPKVPPGQHLLAQMTRRENGDGSTSWMSGDLVTVEIRPGETTSVTFGGGISVVAKLLFPAGLQPRRDWQLFGSVQTPFPTVPAAIAKDPEALRSYYQSPEFEALRKTARQYPAVIEPDGTFTADDVAPGNYLVRVHVVSAGVDNQPPQTIAQAVRPITVPDDSSGGTIDAGEILIEPASAQ